MDSLTAWKHSHFANHTGLKLSFEQHVARCDLHVTETKKKFTGQSAINRPQHKKWFEDFLCSKVTDTTSTTRPMNTR